MKLACVVAVALALPGVALAQQRPRSFWPAEAAAPPAFTSGDFLPAEFAPPFPTTAAAGDGKWLAVLDTEDPNAPPLAFKTTVHPDAVSSFPQVAVVALDLTRLDLTLVAGTLEPTSTAVPAARRPGVIPKERLPSLFAAFNGGFRAVHGRFGVKLDGGDVFLPRRTTRARSILEGKAS